MSSSFGEASSPPRSPSSRLGEKGMREGGREEEKERQRQREREREGGGGWEILNTHVCSFAYLFMTTFLFTVWLPGLQTS